MLSDWKVHVYMKNDEGQQCHERKRERREKESTRNGVRAPPTLVFALFNQSFINPCPPHRGMAKRDLRQIFIILNSPPSSLVRLRILSSLLVEYRLLSDPCFSVIKGFGSSRLTRLLPFVLLTAPVCPQRKLLQLLTNFFLLLPEDRRRQTRPHPFHHS